MASIEVVEARTDPGSQEAAAAADGVPAYLREVYTWAYLNPLAVTVFDRQPIVSTILLGNYHRLERTVLDEIRPGDRVLQLAAVYGPFSKRLAEAIGPDGALDVIEAAPIQVERTARKLAGAANIRVIQGDAAAPPSELYDVVVSFFLLHEVPEDYKTRIVDAALRRLRPGGRAVFVDYHRPSPWHPLRPLIALVFATLEPFAAALWRQDIPSYASHDGPVMTWSRECFFGGMYQKVVGVSENVAPTYSADTARQPQTTPE